MISRSQDAWSSVLAYFYTGISQKGALHRTEVYRKESQSPDRDLPEGNLLDSYRPKGSLRIVTAMGSKKRLHDVRKSRLQLAVGL